jgi:hypothetical protein
MIKHVQAAPLMILLGDSFMIRNIDILLSPMLTRLSLLKVLAIAAVAILVMFGSNLSRAQEFAALVTPPRVEVSSEAGNTIRQTLEITHVGANASTYRVYTADWTYGKDGTVSFFEPLQPNSCRPWVALERKELTLNPQAKRRFRFEIAVPPDAPAGECRFAIMIEGSDITVSTESGVSFPMAGRLGVIVYAKIGKGAPVIEIVSARTVMADGRETPAIEVRNTGNAHGRLAGILNAKDASGASFEVMPNALPIMVGESRTVLLLIASDDKNPARPRFPLEVSGNIEWADKKTPFKGTFAPLPEAAAKPTSTQKIEADSKANK